MKITGPGILGVKKSKWPKIPVLSDYSKTPNQSFWEKFPKKKLPEKPETSINVEKLENRVRKYMNLMIKHQIERSLKAIEYLKHGAPSFQETTLPACFVNKRLQYIQARQRNHGKHSHVDR
jgi:hypothetical protein